MNMNFGMLKGMYRFRYENVESKIYTIAVAPSPFRHQTKDAYILEFLISSDDNNSLILSVGVTGIQLRGWGVSSLTADSKHLRFLLVKGFELIIRELDGEKIFENNEYLFSTKTSPEKLPKIPKQCIFLKDTDGNLICEKHTLMDKAKGYTTYSACEFCQFPEYFAICENLINVETNGTIVNTEHVVKRWISHVDCKEGNKINKDNLTECLSKSCFVPYLIKSPRKVKEKIQSLTSSVFQCMELIDSINIFCKSNHGFKLFQIKQQKIWLELQNPCLTERNFDSQISALSALIDWINEKELRKNLKNPPEKGSLNALEEFLNENYLHFPSGLIKRLRRMKNLRNALIHKNLPKTIKLIKEMGEGYPPDWEKLWDKVILDFLVSLKELEEVVKT